MKFYVLMWQGLSRGKPPVRATFFVAYLLTWVINGMGVAYFSSSADPCYYTLFFPGLPDPYVGLMSLLYSVHQSHPLINIDLQNMLIDNFLEARAQRLVAFVPKQKRAKAAPDPAVIGGGGTRIVGHCCP